METGRPIASAAVYPKIRSADRFQVSMTPSTLLLTIASSEDSTMAARWALAVRARLWASAPAVSLRRARWSASLNPLMAAPATAKSSSARVPAGPGASQRARAVTIERSVAARPGPSPPSHDASVTAGMNGRTANPAPRTGWRAARARAVTTTAAIAAP
jgi:hypothetical protein